MVKRAAKRATRANPRQDRNDPESQNFRGNNRRSQQSNQSHVIPMRNIKRHVDIIPRNRSQEKMVSSLYDSRKHIVFAVGPAGSGKTLMATLYAIKMLKEGHVEKVIISRPNIAVDDKDIGFLPGDIFMKMAPWMKPIMDVFMEYYTKAEIEMMMAEEIIEIAPIAFIRGRTFKNAIVLIDEAQGTTINSMVTILTRIGEGSKMVVTGDVKQTDRGGQNGLSDFIRRHEDNSSSMIDVIRFTKNDVERHEVIKEVLALYPDYEGV